MASAVYNSSDPYEQLIAQMIRLERQPQTTLKAQKSEHEVQRAVLNDFDSALSALHTALKGFTDVVANPFAARKATVSSGATFAASAGDTAAPGTHSLTVERLAAADTRVSAQLAAEGTALRDFFDLHGVQTFSIEVHSPTDDDPGRRVPVAVTVHPVGTTDAAILAEIRQAVADAMGAAVSAGTLERAHAATAAVVNETADSARLSLRSGATGYAGRLTFSDSADGLLALLELDGTDAPVGTGGGAVTPVGTSETDSALNARFVLDGLTLYRGSNTVDDALTGVTLTLNAPGEAGTLTVGPNGDAVAEKVNDFIKKYNAVLGFISQRSKVDAASGARGQFATDTSVRGLRYGMRTDLLSAVDGQPDGLARLTDLGIAINDDGTLKLADKEALTAAVGRDPAAVQRLFAAEDGGLATQLQARLGSFLGTNGSLKARKDSMDARIRRLDKQIASWDTRMERREEELRLQFARLQETIALLQGQSTTLTSFLYG